MLDLTYQMRFPEGFDFVKGGKLPGLYGGTEHSGGDNPDGTNGLSTRHMWRTGGEGEVYAYLATSKEDGTSLGRGCDFAGFTLAEGSEPPAGPPPASGDDDDCGTPATS